MFFVWRHISPFLWRRATSAGRPRTRRAAVDARDGDTWSRALSSPAAASAPVRRRAPPAVRIAPVVVAAVAFLAVPVAVSAVTVAVPVLALRRAVIVRRLVAFWATFPSHVIAALLILARRVNTFDQKEFHIFPNIKASYYKKVKQQLLRGVILPKCHFTNVNCELVPEPVFYSSPVVDRPSPRPSRAVA